MDYGDSLIALTVLLGAAAVTAWLALGYHRREDELNRLWARAAELVGGTFKPAKTTWTVTGSRSIVARIEEARVTADHYLERAGRKQPSRLTRVRAEAPGAGALRLSVYGEAPISRLGKALGFQDVEIGVAGFDARYVIKTSDEAMARAWLDDEAQEAVASCSPYGFAIVDGEAQALRAGVEDSAQQLIEAMRAVAVFAATGRRLLAQWKTVAEEIGGVVSARGAALEPGGRVMTTTERRGRQVLIDLVQQPSGRKGENASLWTRIRARGATPAERFAVFTDRGRELLEAASDLEEVPAPEGTAAGRYRVGSADPEQTAPRLDESLWSRIERLGPDLVSARGDEVTVLVAGLVCDGPRTAAGVDLAAELAAGGAAGPYR